MNQRGQWRRVVSYDRRMSETRSETMPETEGGVREVKSAARTVDLLELLAARGDRPARLQELADELRVPRSSMYACSRP